MNAPNRDLDAAIDHVAARLIAGPGDDAELARRIVGALPERRSRLGWLVPQIAALGALAIAVWVWRSPQPPASTTVLPATPVAMAAALPLPVVPTPARTARPLSATRARTIAAWSAAVIAGERFDHERALPGLVVEDVSTTEIPTLAALRLAPIDISEIETPSDIAPRR